MSKQQKQNGATLPPDEWQANLKTIWQCEKIVFLGCNKRWKCGWCNAPFAKNATKAVAHVAKISGHDIAVSSFVHFYFVDCYFLAAPLTTCFLSV